MPCNSDYLSATHRELELSKVACLLDELNGKDKIDSAHWRGYHPKVYSQPDAGDALVSELCSRLKNKDVTKYSLEMQLWWRDHQKADKDRTNRELLTKEVQEKDMEKIIDELLIDRTPEDVLQSVMRYLANKQEEKAK